MTEQYMSAVPSDPENKWVRWGKGAAVALGCLYIGALGRLIVSADWNDLVASKLFGLVIVLAVLLSLIAALAAGSITVPLRKRWKFWPLRGRVGAVLAAALMAGGVVRQILDADLSDPLARLLIQTGVVTMTLLLLLGWLPFRAPRP